MATDEYDDAHWLAMRMIRCLDVLLGGCLLLAAVLKTWAPADIAILASGYKVPRVMIVGLIQLELVLGLMLISGVNQRLARRACVILFTCFAALSFVRGIAGVESCGCFGQIIVVSPWLSGVVSTVMLCSVAACLSFPPRPCTLKSGQLVSLSVICSILLVASTVRFYYGLPNHNFIDADGLRSDSDVIVLDYSAWIGRNFPLLPFVMSPTDLRRGEYVVLLYNLDCGRCQVALREYERYVSDGAFSGHFVFLEVPPYSDVLPATLPRSSHIRLSDEVEWVVKLPAKLRLQNGIVTEAEPGLATDFSSKDKPTHFP